MVQFHALAIDDNIQNLRVLSQMLSKQNVTCTEVSDPGTLPALIPTLPRIDVVFLDLEMTGVDGFATKDFLRPLIGKSPIIAYTVHVSEMNVVKQLGFDGFLGKPLDPRRFPEQLTRILNGEAVWERA
jgi:two-component system, cell cycle response regulator DivK